MVGKKKKTEYVNAYWDLCKIKKIASLFEISEERQVMPVSKHIHIVFFVFFGVFF